MYKHGTLFSVLPLYVIKFDFKTPFCFYFVLGSPVNIRVAHLTYGCLQFSTTDNDYTFIVDRIVCDVRSGQNLVYPTSVLIQADDGAVFDIEYSLLTHCKFRNFPFPID